MSLERNISTYFVRFQSYSRREKYIPDAAQGVKKLANGDFITNLANLPYDKPGLKLRFDTPEKAGQLWIRSRTPT